MCSIKLRQGAQGRAVWGRRRFLPKQPEEPEHPDDGPTLCSVTRTTQTPGGDEGSRPERPIPLPRPNLGTELPS